MTDENENLFTKPEIGRRCRIRTFSVMQTSSMNFGCAAFVFGFIARLFGQN
jgi:hypothetical protein